MIPVLITLDSAIIIAIAVAFRLVVVPPRRRTTSSADPSSAPALTAGEAPRSAADNPVAAEQDFHLVR